MAIRYRKCSQRPISALHPAVSWKPGRPSLEENSATHRKAEKELMGRLLRTDTQLQGSSVKWYWQLDFSLPPPEEYLKCKRRIFF